MATVVLVGTLDTKAEEYSFLRARVEQAGCDVIMIDGGVLGDPDYPVEFSRREVAEAAGADLDALVEAADRGTAVTTQAEGAAVIAARLHAEGRLHGILAMGGSGGTSIASRAMRELPIGVPKMLVSTMGSGNVRPFVGGRDIAMMFSVVDIAGINPISERILGNAAAGLAAMAQANERFVPSDDPRPLVGATMYGATTPCVDRARARLEEIGYQVVVFHATGTGGRAMEALMESGYLTASLDITPAEVLAEIVGGAFTSGAGRLEMAGSLGLPQVVSIGALDMIAFSPPETLPEHMRQRTLYQHNPHITLVRTNVAESRRVAALMAEKLNAAAGPVSVFIPLRGTSSYGVEGGVFHDPAADAILIADLKEQLDDRIEMVEMDTDINDPEFAVAMAERLDEHYRSWAADRDS